MKKYLFLLFFIVPVYAFSQDVPDVHAHSPKPEKQSKVEKRALQKKEKLRHRQEVGEAKDRKALVKMQTKAVQKRMRQNKHKAKLYNEKKKEFFLVRWFRKKSAY